MFTLWFMGLPCSGKTILAKEVKSILEDKGLIVVHLDGDYVREGLNSDLKFGTIDRLENIRRMGYVAQLLNEQGVIVVASFITPFEEMRQFLKDTINKLSLVWVKCRVGDCKKRDVKGMWKLAAKGKIKNFTGVDGKFDKPAPEDCDIRVDSDINSITSCTNMIISHLYLFKFMDYPGYNYSMFIGRYQPFHKGHKVLIETVLNEGKNVCVAIRDTAKDKKNPYSTKERQEMIEKSLEKWVKKGKVVVMIIPDVIEVCYGRKVGWGIREIKVSKEIEAISATEIRSHKEGEKK